MKHELESEQKTMLILIRSRLFSQGYCRLEFQAALHRIEGNSLLRGGITLVAHFKELNAYTKTQEVSKILTFVNKIMSNNT